MLSFGQIALAILLITFRLPALCQADSGAAQLVQDLKKNLGPMDAVLLADPNGKIIFSKNKDNMLVPASTLKILTTLSSLHYLGKDFKFKTEFYLDNNNLKIKGYGDPLLISEELPDIANALSKTISKINHIILDDSYFEQSLIIPGISSSTEPYDAPNGALCVNFNTVNFIKVNGNYQSAENQTPLLDFALKRIKRTGIDKGRIVLTQKKNECTLYAGNLFKYFLEKNDIQINGRIKIGRVKKSDTLIYTYFSSSSLDTLVAKILEFSNNYMTNQVLLAMGGKIYGSPCNLNKGVDALRLFASKNLDLTNIHVVEGSGISRSNRISAHELLVVLNAFKPYHSLLKREGRALYKTGTLRGISTRAGYIMDKKGRLNRFVILINTPGKSAESIMKFLLKMVQ